MGCDIHLHSEVKIKGKWRHHSTIEVRRNYALFAKMADVRNGFEILPISQPKGLPSDISEVTSVYRDKRGTDGHSDSFLTLEEIKDLCNYIDEQDSWCFPERSHDIFGGFFGNYYTDFEYEGEYSPKGIEDVRFVFWFDN